MIATASQTRRSGMTSKELLLLLLGLEEEGVGKKGVSGITRLQKLLFLTWKEGGVPEVDTLFSFKPYLKGPYSRQLYDDLEFLENMGLVRSQVLGEASESERQAIEQLSFEHLMGSDADPYIDVPSTAEAMTADAFEERRYTLTEKGLESALQLAARDDTSVAKDGIRKIKSKFGHYSLQDLLYHVYSRYEDGGWTSESDIREKVLSRKKKS